MIEFPTHGPESAPEAAIPVFEAAEQAFGMVPNLLRKMAEAPPLLQGYWQLNGLFGASSLSAVEQQVVLVAVSVVNECHYCVGAHSVLADIEGVPSEVTDALREGRPLPDARLQALRLFTQQLVEARGWVSDEQVQAFIDAGYTRPQVLEVVLGVGLKTLSNYTNHLVGTELDEPFAGRAWAPPAA